LGEEKKIRAVSVRALPKTVKARHRMWLVVGRHYCAEAASSGTRQWGKKRKPDCAAPQIGEAGYLVVNLGKLHGGKS